MFLWLIIQLLMTIKPAHKILSLTQRNGWGKPNKWILPPLLQKNKYGRSQLYRDQIFSHTIYLYNRKFDWCLIVDPIWLVWHTYIPHWSTHWTAHNIPNSPTKRYFITKNNSTNAIQFSKRLIQRKKGRESSYHWYNWRRDHNKHWILLWSIYEIIHICTAVYMKWRVIIAVNFPI